MSLFYFALVTLLLLYLTHICCVFGGSFTIDYDHNTFSKDGKPFRYISGTIDYFRVPRSLWQDRLTKAYAGGLDAIMFYIPWNYHQPDNPQNSIFTGDRDVVAYIKQAQEIGLYVILRLGPYVCGEWDFGGFPSWIIKDNASLLLRSSDQNYLKFVEQWYSVLLPMVTPLLYQNGGPVLMVQIENEYGSFFTCDKAYLGFLYSQVRRHLGEEVIVFTTDGNSWDDVSCGSFAPYAYPTVDFGPGADPSSAFSPQRQFAPKGPLVNSEYYPGWLDLWGQPHSTVATQPIINTLKGMLDMGANVNFYMFHGGTTFGYWNGADPPIFQPQPTTYDYDAPISEAGDTTSKYFAIRDLIAKYKPLPNISIPANSSKTAYGSVTLNQILPLPQILESASSLGLQLNQVQSDYPLSMEEMGVNRGFVLYTWQAPNGDPVSGILWVFGVRDRAYVFDQSWNRIGLLDRRTVEWTLMVPDGVTALHILVENQGHINFGSGILNERKGIVSNVSLNGNILQGWVQTEINVEQICASSSFSFSYNSLLSEYSNIVGSGSISAPGFYKGSFEIKGAPNDTFVQTQGWGKGVLLAGPTGSLHNLGRYWPLAGPQLTLYLPAPFLAQGTNQLCAFELEQPFCTSSTSGSLTFQGTDDNSAVTCSMSLLDVPKLNGPVHYAPRMETSNRLL